MRTTRRHLGILLLLCLFVGFIALTAADDNSTSVQVPAPSGSAAAGNESHPDYRTEKDKEHGDENGTEEEEEEHVGIVVAGFEWEYVRQPFVITMVLIAAGILKLGFHHAGRLPHIVPESCVLIILGTIVGGILYASDSNLFTTLEPSFFFLILLPPIILESSYSLYDRVFFDNLGTILLYAVVGTVLNCFLIGPTLYGLYAVGAMGALPFKLTLLHCLVFAALIVAVDPVAVLAIFQEIGVNNVLYFLVFGESLLNDAVTVVLYNMMKEFNNMETIPVSQIFLGIASFFTVSLIGMLIGIIFGIFTALFTRYTAKVRVVEPLAIFTLAYASYLTADLFEFSGIISIFSCGLVQAHYSFHNVSHKSATTVLYFSKMISATCDCIIFMFLGLALWKKTHHWHTGFVVWSLILCLVFRFVVTYFLTFLANKIKRIRKIDYLEQFIMAYGGLRGAVAFSLVAMLDKKKLPERMEDMFETTTLVIVLFTVFVQGMTIKPLVKFFRIRKEGTKVVSLFDEITDHITDHVMAGIEEIVGYSGRNTLRETLGHYDDRYFKRLLQRTPMSKDQHIMELYKEISIQDHYDTLACSVGLERYPDQMVVCHADKEDNDTFNSMAVTHPILAQRALDKELRRRSSDYQSANRSRSMTAPIRMLSEPAPDHSSPIVLDVESARSGEVDRNSNGTHETVTSAPPVGFPQKTASLDPSQTDVTVENLRKMFVKPAETLHQKHNKNLLDDGETDLVHLLHEKQCRTSRYLRSVSFSSPTDTGSPSNASPAMAAYSRPRGMTVGEMQPTRYVRRHPLDIRMQYETDSRSRNMKLRSASMGAEPVQREAPLTPPPQPLEPITEMRRAPSVENGEILQEEEPMRKKPTADIISETPNDAPDADSNARGRNPLSRQDKVSDVSPTKTPLGYDVTDGKDTQDKDSGMPSKEADERETRL